MRAINNKAFLVYVLFGISFVLVIVCYGCKVSSPNIIRQLIVKDYLFMWEKIENEYPLDCLISKIDGNADNASFIKEYYLNILNKIEIDNNGMVLTCDNTRIPWQKAVLTIFGKSIEQFDGLGHLRVLTANDYYFAKQGYEFPLRTKLFYGSFDEEELTFKKQKSSIENIVTFENKDGIPIIHFRTFSGVADENQLIDLINAVDSFCEMNSNSKYFIVDLRGNRGGNSVIWQEGLRRILPKNKSFRIVGGIKKAVAERVIDSKQNVKVIELSRATEVISEDELEAIRFAGLPLVVVEDKAPLEVFNGRYLEEASFDPYKGRIFILVDGCTASSAEMLVTAAKSIGFATIIGETTRGSGRYIETPLIEYQTPNLGIWFDFELSATLNDDNSFNALIGTIPDVETKEDALVLCLKIIEGEK